ncbi:MAG: HlyD family secretion protein [Clostridiales bacterium]|jgi:multidrug efflux pump subunit AcrA (membrane-fusion protein)|nr:HlyD family secretion protein [Clostridiales bacterium]
MLNVLSFRKKAAAADFQSDFLRIAKFVDESGLTKSGPTATVTYTADAGGDGVQLLDMELLMPLNEPFSPPDGCTCKPVFKLVNAAKIRHEGNPAGLQNTMNELLAYIQQKGLQPITSVYNVTVKEARTPLEVDGMIVDMYSITSNQGSIEQLEGELKSIGLSIEAAAVTAPISGFISMDAELNEGEMLGAGAEVAAIVPDDGTDYKIQLMILNEDIASIQGAQKIRYHFSALPYREYGEASGEILKIGTDATAANGISYYLVDASLNELELTSYDGTAGSIKVGMACEAQVVTQSKKILWWLLEKINLRD